MPIALARCPRSRAGCELPSPWSPWGVGPTGPGVGEGCGPGSLRQRPAAPPVVFFGPSGRSPRRPLRRAPAPAPACRGSGLPALGRRRSGGGESRSRRASWLGRKHRCAHRDLGPDRDLGRLRRRCHVHGCDHPPDVGQLDPHRGNCGERPVGDRRLALWNGSVRAREGFGAEDGRPRVRSGLEDARLRAVRAEAEQPQRGHDRAGAAPATVADPRSQLKLVLMSLALPPTTRYDVIGTTGRFLNPPTPFGGRFRLLFAMVFLALPLVGGIWAFAGFVGRSGEQRAESQLAGELRAAVHHEDARLAPVRPRSRRAGNVQLALVRTTARSSARSQPACPVSPSPPAAGDRSARSPGRRRAGRSRSSSAGAVSAASSESSRSTAHCSHVSPPSPRCLPASASSSGATVRRR